MLIKIWLYCCNAATQHGTVLVYCYDEQPLMSGTGFRLG